MVRSWLAVVLCVFCQQVASAAEPAEKPTAWFCFHARTHRALFASDKAAEDAARALGATPEIIAKAHRCKRR